MRQRQEGSRYRYRERWVGPGIVLLHEGGTVWVAVRGRLLKGNPGHIRLATNPESLGAELLNLQELEAIYCNIRGRGGPHVDMTRAHLPPDGDRPDNVSSAVPGDASEDSGAEIIALTLWTTMYSNCNARMKLIDACTGISHSRMQQLNCGM